jgi:hypothetical protein
MAQEVWVEVSQSQSQPCILLKEILNIRALVGEVGSGANANCYSMLKDTLDYLAANDVYIGWTGWAAGPRKTFFFFSLAQN